MPGTRTDGNDERENMSHEGQTPGGYPQQGPPQHNPQAPAPQPGEYAPQAGQPGQQAQPGQYAPQQPGQYAPQQGQQGGYAPGQQGQPGGYAPGQQGGYAPGQPTGYAPGQQGGYAPQAPAAPRPNPFKGIPVADFVRDGAALLLLLVSLALWVTAGEKVGDSYHFVVIIVTVISVLSLALPYLARGGVFPASWTVHQTRLARQVANAPYVLAVVVYVVLDIFKVGDSYGVGTAFGLGLAGALLAAQPRETEMGPENLDLAAPKTWRAVTFGLAGLVAVTMLISLVVFLVNAGDYGSAIIVILGIVSWLVLVGFFGWAVYGVLVERSPSWRLFLVGLGTALVVVFLFGSGDSSSFLQAQSTHALFWNAPPTILSLQAGLGSVFLPALAAAVSSPAFRRTLRSEDTTTSWIGTAVHALDYLAIVAGSTVVLSALWIGIPNRDLLEIGLGGLITSIILGLVVAGAAVYARLTLAARPANGRNLAFGAAGLALVLGIVLIVVAPTIGNRFAEYKLVSEGHLLLAFALPAIIVVALTVPKEIRGYFAENRPAPRAAANAAYQWTQPQGGQPGQVPQGQYGAPQGAYGAPQGQYGDLSSQYGAPQQGQYGTPVQDSQSAPTAAYGMPSAQPGYSAPAGQHGSPEAGYGSVPAAQTPAAQTPAAQDPAAGQSPWQAPVVSPESEIDQDTHLAGYVAGLAASGAQGQAPQHEQPTGQPGYAPAEQPAPVEQAPAPVVTAAHGYSAAQALDPSTTGLVLSQIVQEAPELRPQVAANPTTYPALLDWLGQLGDPAVDEALRNRQG